MKKHKNDESILHFRDDLNLIEHRTIRLASARNLIIEEIKNNQKLRDFDLLIMLDFDDRSIFKIEDPIPPVEPVRIIFKFLRSIIFQ